MSVKWDGAPAVVCGVNPDNGKFFVGTKSVFAKNAKINYTKSDNTPWTISAQMVKSVAVGATEPASCTFVVGFSSAAKGTFISSLAHNITGNFSEGRYFHNSLVSSGSTVYNLAAGNVKVNAGIASAPS